MNLARKQLADDLEAYAQKIEQAHDDSSPLAVTKARPGVGGRMQATGSRALC